MESAQTLYAQTSLGLHRYAFATGQCQQKHYVFGLSVHCIHSSGQILLPRYLMNSLHNLNETCREYSITLTNDLIRFGRSKVKVTAGHQCSKDIHVDVGASKSIFIFNTVFRQKVTFHFHA